MTDDRLFEVAEAPAKLSYTQRLTIKRRDLLANGVHPATGARLANNGETCGSCIHSIKVGYRSRSYWKCDRVQITAGPGTDIRVGWPACSMWSAELHMPDCQSLHR